MKVFPKCLASLAVLALPLCSSGSGDDRGRDVSVALAVQQAKLSLANKAAARDGFSRPKAPAKGCRCDGPENCTCPDGLCSCPACSTAWTRKAFDAAKRQNLPVLVFVGQSPYYAAGFLSYQAEDYADTPKPGAILLAKDADGELVVVKRFSGRPTESQVAEALMPPEPVRRSAPPSAPASWVTQPVFPAGAAAGCVPCGR